MTWWQKWHNDKNDIHGKGNKSDKLTNMTKNHKHYKYRINDIYEMTKMAKIIQKSQKIKYNTEWNVRGNKKMHFIKDRKYIELKAKVETVNMWKFTVWPKTKDTWLKHNR